MDQSEPSEEDIDRWVMLEDGSPHPREMWLRQQAWEALPTLDRPDVECIVDIETDTVTFRKPRYVEVWLPDTHLTGRTGREIDGYDILGTYEPHR